MYLSRIAVDRQNRSFLQAVSVPEYLHAAIENCIAGARSRNLWRVDTVGQQDYLLIVSQQPADFSSLKEKFGKQDGKQVEPSICYENLFRRLEKGQTWHFRLCANPTISVSQKNKRGKVLAIQPSEKEAWLVSRAAKHGFLVEPEQFSVVSHGWKRFKKGKAESSHTITLYTVTYEGVLEITDAPEFCRTLSNGMGRGKAYGCGMLTIAR